jgi:hypothetical protein
MTHTVPFLDRRRLLSLLTGLPILGRAGGALAMAAVAAPAFSDFVTILVAGPDGGILERWSRVIQPALTQSLPPETPIHRVTAGAADGVTGANQFEARSAPDGETILLVPGEAAITWLVGDPRAQYDVARWVSVMAVVTPGLVVARPGATGADRKPRFATSGPAGVDLPAVLGLELLGSRVELLPALAEGSESAAFAGGSIDAVFLRGHKVAEQAAALAGLGAVPVFSLGALDPAGKLTRCPAFPTVPTLLERYATTRGQAPVGPLCTAWCAAAVASQIECGLVLPQLTPAAMVALWRRAGADAAASLEMQSVAMSLGVRAIGGSEATATAGAAAGDQMALREVRRWLTERFGWQPV